MKKSIGKSINILLALSFVFISFVLNEADAAYFQGLGFIAPGDKSSEAFGISPDGFVVVGISYRPPVGEAFRWTKAGGMEGLGFLPNKDWSECRGNGASNKGTVIAGTSGYEAFRWTETTGMVGLGYLPGGDSFSVAKAVSASGNTIVGFSDIESGYEAFKWTESTGMVGLGDLPGGYFDSYANGISADGTVIIGFSIDDFGTQAFRWTELTGMVGLGRLTTNGLSIAEDISADGSVIVGWADTPNGTHEAFRWTESGGIVSIGKLPGDTYSSAAFGVSADGSIVVGSSRTTTGPNQRRAFIWDEGNNSMRDLKEILEGDFGIDMTGWILSRAEKLSADGLTIVGWGKNPDGKTEAWIANIGPTLIEVIIDIKPCIYPNRINLKSRGKVPVAILTTNEFDASDVDPNTVVFAGASPLRWRMKDVNKDGNHDMLLHFIIQELDLSKNSSEATLEGETFGGIQITGTDTVKIVPKRKKHGKRGKKGNQIY